MSSHQIGTVARPGGAPARLSVDWGYYKKFVSVNSFDNVIEEVIARRRKS